MTLKSSVRRRSWCDRCRTREDGTAAEAGSANASARRIGTVLACVRPAVLTIVPMRVSTPSACNWAITLSSGVIRPRCHSARLGRVRTHACPMSRVRNIRPIPSHSAQEIVRVREQFIVEMLAATFPRNPRHREDRCVPSRSGARTRPRYVPVRRIPARSSTQGVLIERPSTPASDRPHRGCSCTPRTRCPEP